MVKLKRVRASSLNEIIVATLLIMIIFGISGGVLNNILRNISHTKPLDSKLNEYIYLYKNDKIKPPYNLSNDHMTIQVKEITKEEYSIIEFSAYGKDKMKTITRIILKNEEN